MFFKTLGKWNLKYYFLVPRCISCVTKRKRGSQECYCSERYKDSTVGGSNRIVAKVDLVHNDSLFCVRFMILK
jgi:hypothetical protein